MNITIHSSMLPHADPDASLAFYRDVLGFEIRLDGTRPPSTPASPTMSVGPSPR